MDHRRTVARNLGLLLALSTPASAFVSFALFASAFGEDRFEGADGVTGLGYLVMAIPLVIGLGIAAIAHFDGPLPDRRTLSLMLGALGIGLLGLGISTITSSANDNDASIGGAFLVFAGLAAGVLALVFGRLKTSPGSPPPPGPPNA